MLYLAVSLVILWKLPNTCMPVCWQAPFASIISEQRCIRLVSLFTLTMRCEGCWTRAERAGQEPVGLRQGGQGVTEDFRNEGLSKQVGQEAESLRVGQDRIVAVRNRLGIVSTIFERVEYQTYTGVTVAWYRSQLTWAFYTSTSVGQEIAR